MNRRKLPAEIVDQVLDLIGQGLYKKGTRLPSQSWMARAFGVSRPTLREALQALELMGVIKVTPRQGMMVEGLISEVLPRASALGAIVDQRTRDNLFEIRWLVEPAMAVTAARRARPAELRAIERILVQYEAALENDRPVHELAGAFHLLIAQACHNRILTYLVHTVMGLLASDRERLQSLRGFDRWELESHRRIYRAMTRRFPSGAQGPMLDHLRLTAEAYRCLAPWDPQGAWSVARARALFRQRAAAETRADGAPLEGHYDDP